MPASKTASMGRSRRRLRIVTAMTLTVARTALASACTILALRSLFLLVSDMVVLMGRSPLLLGSVLGPWSVSLPAGGRLLVYSLPPTAARVPGKLLCVQLCVHTAWDGPE